MRGAVRTAWGVVWRPLVVAAAVGLLVWALGLVASSAGVVAVAVATVTAVLQRVDTAPEPRPAHRVHVERDGVRGEVLELAWAMVGRDGRAGERALRRLRAAAARRVARHGLDLADAGQAAAVTDLLGERAYATLTRLRHPLPSVPDLVHTLGVLEDLGAARSRPAALPTGAPAALPTAAPAPTDAPAPHGAADLPPRTATDPRSPR